MPTAFDTISILDGLGFYGVIFPLILISAVVYGLLQKIEIFGDNQAINATVSVILAFIVVSMSVAVDFIAMFIQIMVVFMLVVLFIVMILMFGGVKGETIQHALSQPAAYIMIIAVTLIVTFVVMASILPPAEEDFLLFHPTVVALMVMFLVFVATSYVITRVER